MSKQLNPLPAAPVANPCCKCGQHVSYPDGLNVKGGRVIHVEGFRKRPALYGGEGR